MPSTMGLKIFFILRENPFVKKEMEGEETSKNI